MDTNTEFIKLPMSLGLEINKILAKKIQFIPREDKMGLLSFEYTSDELALIDKLEFDNPITGSLEGIELLPNLKSLIIKSSGNSSYTQNKYIASISDRDAVCIAKCKNLENLNIDNQAELSFIDVGQLKKLHSLIIKGNARLEEIYGLDALKELIQFDCVGNESLTRIKDLNDIIMGYQDLIDLNLDLLLYPDAVGYDVNTGTINEETIERFDDMMNVSWQEILSNGKVIKISNNQMMGMHQKACKALEEYVPKHCETITSVIGIEKYLAENIKYDDESLNHNNSHVSSSKTDCLPTIRLRLGPKTGANGAFNAFTFGTCVCEGYTRAMQYLLRLKGIKSHNVHCISGEDKLHMATFEGDDDHRRYNLPDDGYHSIISIDDFYYLYDDPCWNAGGYQNGDKTMPWILLTKEEISKDHTLSFGERNIDNNTIKVPRSLVQSEFQVIANYRKERKRQQEIFSEQEIGRATVSTQTKDKDRAKEQCQRDMEERINQQKSPHHKSKGDLNDER